MSQQDSFEIEYEGKKIHAFYTFNKRGTYIFRFEFINVSSCFGQAIMLHLDTFRGRIFMDEKEIILSKRRFPQLVFSQKRYPKQFELKIILDDGDITICNGSDSLGNEVVWHSISMGCAMIIENIQVNKWKFYCNDHENDDDFDDLIFGLEILKI